MVKNLPAMQETPLDREDPLEKRMYSSPLPLQYSCLENFMDRGAWRAIVHGVWKLPGDKTPRCLPSLHTVTRHH